MGPPTTRKNDAVAGAFLSTRTRNFAALSMDVKVSRFSTGLMLNTIKIAYRSLVWLFKNTVIVVNLVSRKWTSPLVPDLRAKINFRLLPKI